MIDDSMGNVLNKYLEDIIVRQDNQLLGLLAERDNAFATIAKKDEHMEGLMEHIKHLTKTIDALAGYKVKLQNEVGAYKANYQPLNNLIDLLEEEVDDLEHEVMGLKDQREANHRRIAEKDKIIIGLQDDLNGAERFLTRIRELENEVVGLEDDVAGAMRYAKRLEDTNLALVIQAAESEDRADDERRGRLQLVMRM